MIEFIVQHNTDKHRRKLLSRFHRAISRAAGDHFIKWRLGGSQLWCKLTGWIRRVIPNRHLSSWNKRLIRSVIDTRFTPSKRKRSSPQDPNTVIDVPSPRSNSRPSKLQRPNPRLPDDVLNILVEDSNGEPLRNQQSKLQLPTITPNDIPDIPLPSTNNMPPKRLLSNLQLPTITPNDIPDIPLPNTNNMPSKRLLSKPQLPDYLQLPTITPDDIPDIPLPSTNNMPSKYLPSKPQLPYTISDTVLQRSNNDSACENNDSDFKLTELPSPTHTPQ